MDRWTQDTVCLEDDQASKQYETFSYLIIANAIWKDPGVSKDK